METVNNTIIRDIKNLNLNHLFYFHTIAKTGSLTEAAKKLRISQPTLSQQIMKLESSLSTELFSRKGRGITLSENGSFLFVYTAKIFDLTEEMLSNFNYQKYQSNIQMYRIGFSQTSPRLILSRLILPLFERHDFGVQISEKSPDKLLQDLRKRELDFFIAEEIGGAATQFEELSIKRVYSPRYHIVVSKNSSLANKKGESLDNIVNGANYFKFPKRNPLQSKIDRYFLINDLHPYVVGECQDMQTACSFLHQSESFAILPEIIFSSHENLVSLFDLADIEPVHLSAFYLNNYDNHSVEELVEIIRKS